MFKIFASLFLGIASLFSGVSHNTAMVVQHFTHQATSTQQVELSQDQLVAMGGNIYADGNLPLGDKKYVTNGAKKGYIYLCNVPQNNGGGAQNDGSWIHGNTWNIKEKIAVQGYVSWPQAAFNNTIAADTRVLSGNGLPVGNTTGVFPIASADPAYQIDRNPNSIQVQSLNLTLPINPTYSDIPNCMGMEVGVMTNGVPLFNGFDAELRDAAAHEVQDSCDGHPQSGGEYHYHSLSSCITDTSVSTVIGYALDGFPITGPKVADGKYLTTDNLDDCHGITSSIMLDGKEVTMYHYVMTEDFPYSVSCFRGKPVSYQVIANGMMQGGQHMTRQTGVQNGMRVRPPQEAYTVCSGKTEGTSCSFSAPRGTVTGTCQNPSGQQIVCVPTMPEQNSGRPINY